MLQLYIGNKNYSSWSMRPWVLMKQFGIAFEEIMVRFDAFDGASRFKQTMLPLHAAGTVPLLCDGTTRVNDSLAICEYLAELHPEHAMWPRERAARAQARSICAEMHGGFRALRQHCAMNIEADLSLQGQIILRDQPGVRADLQRIVSMWSELLRAHGGPMLFGEFGIADAYYAPVVSRFKTYALPVPDDVGAYMARVLDLPAVRDWTAQALAEHDFVAFDEPYRIAATPA